MTDQTSKPTSQPHDPTEDPYATPDEAGAYVGRLPERQAETIPGGVRPDDERIAAHSTQTTPIDTGDATPSGHREGQHADDNQVREAGENH